MKIEICEQIIASWLKHCKGCQIVQTNWCPSPLTLHIDEDSRTKLTAFIEAVKEKVSDGDLDIFKKSTVEQFVSQCEVDVIGIKIGGGKIETLYMIDTAFHENGLNYSDVVARVLKKVLRPIIVSDIVFKSLPVTVAFVSPFCRETTGNAIRENIDKLEYVLKEYYPDSSVSLIFNEAFTEEIYSPLIAKMDSIADDNDLFLRSIKLSAIAQKYQQKNTNAYETVPIVHNTEQNGKTPRGENEKFVFSILNDLKSKGILSSQLISSLCSPEYTKQEFKIYTFPFLLKSTDFESSGFDRKKFYKKSEFFINGTGYLVCSQWIPGRIKLLQTWYEEILASNGNT